VTGGLTQWEFATLVAVVPGGTQEEGATVGELTENDATGDFQSPLWVIGVAILSTPKNNVAGDRACDPGQVPPVLIQKGNRDSSLGTSSHQSGTAGHAAEADQGAKGEEWDAESGFAFNAYQHRLTLQCEIRILKSDVQSVQ